MLLRACWLALKTLKQCILLVTVYKNTWTEGNAQLSIFKVDLTPSTDTGHPH